VLAAGIGGAGVQGGAPASGRRVQSLRAKTSAPTPARASLLVLLPQHHLHMPQPQTPRSWASPRTSWTATSRRPATRSRRTLRSACTRPTAPAAPGERRQGQRGAWGGVGHRAGGALDPGASIRRARASKALTLRLSSSRPAPIDTSPPPVAPPSQLHRRVPHRQRQPQRERRQGGDDQGRRQARRARQRDVQLPAAGRGAFWGGGGWG
jgi:hypothetical protein